MSEYVILTESSCDLSPELAAQADVDESGMVAVPFE